MPAGRYSLTIERGAVFDVTILYSVPDPDDPDDRSKDTPKNLTGWSARAQVRTSHGAPNPPLLDLLSSNGSGQPRIILGGAAGTIRMVIPAASSAAIAATVKNAVWDLELTDPANLDGPIRFLEGAVVFTPEVTR